MNEICATYVPQIPLGNPSHQVEAITEKVQAEVNVSLSKGHQEDGKLKMLGAGCSRLFCVEHMVGLYGPYNPFELNDSIVADTHKNPRP